MRYLWLFFILSCSALQSYAAQSPLIEPATLRTQLPTTTLGYMRIPNVWGLLAVPKNNVLHSALANETMQAQMQTLETAVYQHLLKESEQFTGPLLPLLLHHLRSPIEVAFLLPENTPFTFMQTLVSAKLNFTDIKELEMLLQQIAQLDAKLQISKPFDAQGIASLLLNGIPVSLQYIAEKRTLYVLTGMTANPLSLQEAVNSLKSVENHPMYSLENQIDSSGYGTFFWLNVERGLPIIEGWLPAEELEKLSLKALKAIGFGWGISNGKGRIKLMLDIPHTGYLTLIPAVKNQLKLTTVGKPYFVFSLTLPLAEILQKWEEFFRTTLATPEDWSDYQKFKAEFQQEVGISLDDTMNAVGKEWIIWMDKTGIFMGIEQGNDKIWQHLLSYLQNKHKAILDTRTAYNATYFHLNLPVLLSVLTQDVQEQKSNAEEFWFKLLSRLNSHYYWMVDEGYLVFGYVPQQLMDRQRSVENVELYNWFINHQKQDVTHSLLAFSANIPETPMYLYYFYLQLLSILGDLADSPFPLFDLPSVNDLQLPSHGTYGFQVDWGESGMAMEIIFEDNPLEFLLFTPSSFSSTATIGILAAIAIPAYSDYLKRAKVMEAVNLLAGLKTPAEEYYGSKGQFPKVTDLTNKTSGKYTAIIGDVEGQMGFYAVMKEETGITGTLYLLFDSEANMWTCVHEGMQESYLPQTCKE